MTASNVHPLGARFTTWKGADGVAFFSVKRHASLHHPVGTSFSGNPVATPAGSPVDLLVHILLMKKRHGLTLQAKKLPAASRTSWMTAK